MAGITKIIYSLWKALPTPFSSTSTDAKTSRLAKLRLLAYPVVTAGIAWGCYSLWRWFAQKHPTPPKKPSPTSVVQVVTPQPTSTETSVSSSTPQNTINPTPTVQNDLPSTVTPQPTSKILPTATNPHLLSDDLFEKAKACIDDDSYLTGLLESSHEDEPVYFPKDIPVVLKKCGSSKTQKRVESMRLAREICEKNGYKYLIIPQVQSYKDFTIETRLPIDMQGTKEQIGLYVEHHEKFTEAVKCFTALLFQTGWSHIAVSYDDIYALLLKKTVGKYDHFPLILEDGQGKIALTNFKYFSPHRSTGWLVDADLRKYLECRDAIYFFPYHFQEIVEISKKFEPTIEEGQLSKIREQSLELFKSVYENHLTFVQGKGITPSNPLAFAEITPARKEALKQTSIKILREDYWFKRCLGKNPEQTIKAFKAVFPEILNTITQFIVTQLNQTKQEPISSYQKLLSSRSLIFYRTSECYWQLTHNIGSKLTMIQKPSYQEIENFAATLVEGVFAELARGKEIAYYGVYENSRSNRHVIFL